MKALMLSKLALAAGATLVVDGQARKVYPVAVGRPSTPSPVGTRWMGLSIPGYGIHGTNEPKSIGKAASHGCIRTCIGAPKGCTPTTTLISSDENGNQANSANPDLSPDGRY